MTASERLRELKAEGIVVADAPGEGYPDRVLLTERQRDLIADVVEAAERMMKRLDEGGPYERREAALGSALTALREALGEK